MVFKILTGATAENNWLARGVGTCKLGQQVQSIESGHIRWILNTQDVSQ